MNVSEQLWYDEQNPSAPQTLPQGVCFATMCSVGATSRGQLFLSDPSPASNGAIPVFSVREYNETMYVGTLSTLSSTNPDNDRHILLEKNRVNPSQPIGFNILKSAAGMASDSDVGVYVTAQAELTNQSSVLQYNITGTASVSLYEMNLTPKIWKKTDTGDMLVFAGEPVTCSGVNACQATGDFTPSGAASYFVNATVRYTLPSPVVMNGVEIRQVAIDDARDGGRPPAVPEVVVTGELSPLEPGKIADSANVNNTVPWGGAIEHVMVGDVPMTVVYNSSGKPQFRADDRKARDFGTPYGYTYPGTWIHEVPSGSNVDLGNTRSIVTYNGTLSYDENYSLNSMNPREITGGSHQKGVNEATSVNGYIELATGDGYTLNHLSGNWKVPSNPTSSSSNPQTIFLFNGVQGKNAATGNQTIVQPVLEWYNNDTGKYWTISPWVCGEPCVHTVRLSASTGDEINGNMHYLPPDSTETTDFWQVSITNKKTSSTKVNTTTQITNKSLKVIAGALEGYYLTESSALPGDTTFYSTTYLDVNYKPVSVSLSKFYPLDEPAWIKKSSGY